jgi:uncharacterized surface protein with fasciclin (FAS1) repeats
MHHWLRSVSFDPIRHALFIPPIIRAPAARELSCPAYSCGLCVKVIIYMEQSNNSSTNQQISGSYVAPSKDLIDSGVSTGNSTTFMSAVRSAGLTDMLTGKGPFTVFAPTDEAFKKLSSGALDALIKDTAKLRAVLSYHVVKGHILAKDVKAGEMMTMQGSPLMASVSTSGVEVNGVPVNHADTVATNGVIHTIDSVIMPKHWQLLAVAA